MASSARTENDDQTSGSYLETRQADLREQRAVGAKAGVDPRGEANETASEQTGADDEREGQRHFDGHEDRA